jgi:hypothetical protein
MMTDPTGVETTTTVVVGVETKSMDRGCSYCCCDDSASNVLTVIKTDAHVTQIVDVPQIQNVPRHNDTTTTATAVTPDGYVLLPAVPNGFTKQTWNNTSQTSVALTGPELYLFTTENIPITSCCTGIRSADFSARTERCIGYIDSMCEYEKINNVYSYTTDDTGGTRPALHRKRRSNRNEIMQHVQRQRQRLDDLHDQIQQQEDTLLALQRKSDHAFVTLMTCSGGNRRLYWEWRQTHDL